MRADGRDDDDDDDDDDSNNVNNRYTALYTVYIPVMQYNGSFFSATSIKHPKDFYCANLREAFSVLHQEYMLRICSFMCVVHYLTEMLLGDISFPCDRVISI